MFFSIITPCVGHSVLKRLIESLNSQTIKDFEHVIVIDGNQYNDNVDKILNDIEPEGYERYIIRLPKNTGKEGGWFCGHRIYAGVTHFVNGDYLCFLDEDNFYDRDHLENYYNLIKNNDLEWCFSLRNIVDIDGKFICKDNCESLGYLHHAFYNNNIYFIDTSCTCIRREIAIETSYKLHRKCFNNDGDSDRIFSRTLMENYPKYMCTKKHTVNYLVEEDKPNSVKKELFINGNNLIKNWYNGQIPWENGKEIHIVFIDPINTVNLIKNIYEGNINIDIKGYYLSGYKPYMPKDSFIILYDGIIKNTPKHIKRNDVSIVKFML
tara:strand:+ start:131 stop:1099 length:969 start_codon:yes stop_codon:yes gene_type:complete